MRDPDARKHCPLLKREIYWGCCCEVQEVRNDDMDMELLEVFDLAEAEEKCSQCLWYNVRIPERP